MIAGLSALEFFGAIGTAVTIFGGGIQLGRKLGARSSSSDLDQAQKETSQARQDYKTAQDQASSAQRALADIRAVLDDKTDVWLRPHPDLGGHLSRIRSSIPIVTVCNFKGGVGKTTLSSLLASYFDLEKQKRVLLIDFDYQGSLTDAMLAAADLPELEASSRWLLQNNSSREQVLHRAVPLRPVLPRSSIFTCFYGFNRVENAAMMKWISDISAEVRFRTHEVLSGPDLQDQFDLVIIDAPPRLSTATINAFCASTHVLIPTILDNISTQAALNTLNVIQEFRTKLNPALEVLGVVPTLVSTTSMNNAERDSLERLQARLPEFWRKPPYPHVFAEQRICRRAAIAEASGVTLAYSANADVRKMVMALGDEISERLFSHAHEDDSASAQGSSNVATLPIGRRRA